MQAPAQTTESSLFPDWFTIRPEGLYCRPAECYIDPWRPVERAVVTHGHADHARPGHAHVFTTPATMAIMQTRYGMDCTQFFHATAYGESWQSGSAQLSLHPAGHILGSAQLRIESGGLVALISGDYKRRADPTCTVFEPVPCDLFITEATFGLPVFTHPPIETEIEKLLHSHRLFPERCHLVGVYALGKCQRVMLALRAAGYNRPIYVHGALVALCELYEKHGIDLGEWHKVSATQRETLVGEIILAPPSALMDRWASRLPNPVIALASGWMRIRARARQKGVDLPLIISDHADWPELLQTLDELRPKECWVTHGREEGLIHAAQLRGIQAQALSLVGFEEEASD